MASAPVASAESLPEMQTHGLEGEEMRGSDLTSRRFGRLLVLRSGGLVESGTQGGRVMQWTCICDCGNTLNVVRQSLMSGNTKSCGCLHTEVLKSFNIKHGHSSKLSGKTPEYTAWTGMKQRVLNPKCKFYKWYGGRGIKVCARWIHSFENFLEDMGRRPDGMSLGRRDNNKDYCKSNCRWETRDQQDNNRSDTVRLKYKNKTMGIAQWSRICKINSATLSHRITTGIPVDLALEIPPNASANRKLFPKLRQPAGRD
jgi:hypothetical protein